MSSQAKCFCFFLNPHHQTLNDSKVVIDDLGQGSQAVGGAGSVAMEGTQASR